MSFLLEAACLWVGNAVLAPEIQGHIWITSTGDSSDFKFVLLGHR